MSIPRDLTDHYASRLLHQCTGASALTDARRERMASWTAGWIERQLSCQPADWDAFEQGARRCYQYGGEEWPEVVVRVPSPLVGVVATMAVQPALTPEWLPFWTCPVDGFPKQALGWAAYALADLVARGAPLSDAAAEWLERARVSPLPSVRGTVCEVDRTVASGGLQDPMSTAVARAVQEAFVAAQKRKSILGDAEWHRRYDTPGLNWRLRLEPPDDAMCSLIDVATLETVLRGVAQPVSEALGESVETAVSDAVSWAGGAQNSKSVLHEGGWGLGMHAVRTFLREVCNVDLPESVWGPEVARVQAATSASWWWPDPLFVVVSDRPSEIHLRPPGLDGTGPVLQGDRSIRRGLRRGPAVVWRDGSGLWPRADEERVRYPGLLPAPAWEIRPKWNAHPWYEVTKHLP